MKKEFRNRIILSTIGTVLIIAAVLAYVLLTQPYFFAIIINGSGQ